MEIVVSGLEVSKAAAEVSGARSDGEIPKFDSPQSVDGTNAPDSVGDVNIPEFPCDVDLDERMSSDGKETKNTEDAIKELGVDADEGAVSKLDCYGVDKENDVKGLEKTSERKEVEEKRMEPPVEVKFKCPEGVDPKEFYRQLKGQERGLNSQTVAENTRNRESYEARKAETGNGRDPEGTKAQELARQKALQSRIESNQKKGMSYVDAKSEAETWIKGQAALHNPDQIAGGEPTKVSRMGDANANASIGSQWRSRVDVLKKAIDAYSDGKSPEELANTKLNVKLVMEDNSNGTTSRNA